MRRLPELDALRGLAALVVVLYHIGLVEHKFDVHFGWSAVDLFFILSGYLITTILLQHRPTRQFFAAFYGRRALRIWPIYYLGILTLVVLTPLFAVRPSWDNLASYLTYTQNFRDYITGTHTEDANAMLSHTWTLAIEEQFYLVWPVLVMLAGRKWLVPLSLAVVVAANAARFAGLPQYVLLSRCDGLALGALLAALLFDREKAARNLRAYQALFVSAGVVGIAYLGWFEFLLRGPRTAAAEAGFVSSFIFIYFGLIGLVLCHSGHRALTPLRGRRLGYLGQISYGLYFYHNIFLYPLYDYAQRLGLGYPVWLQAAILPLSVAAAHLSWTYLERPLLAFKDRLPYDREPAPRRVRTELEVSHT
jgi:peptidoglycan/LPS O-acetylase OafA/YrhL